MSERYFASAPRRGLGPRPRVCPPSGASSAPFPRDAPMSPASSPYASVRPSSGLSTLVVVGRCPCADPPSDLAGTSGRHSARSPDWRALQRHRQSSARGGGGGGSGVDDSLEMRPMPTKKPKTAPKRRPPKPHKNGMSAAHPSFGWPRDTTTAASSPAKKPIVPPPNAPSTTDPRTRQPPATAVPRRSPIAPHQIAS